MIINIETKVFDNDELNPSQLIFLYLKFTDFNYEAGKFKDYKNSSISEEELILKGYLDDSLNITAKTFQLFGVHSDILWEEFIREYPKETPSRRKLQTQIDACKVIYLDIVGNDKNLHDFIIKCLKKEKYIRGSTGQMEYFNSLPNYLTNKAWKVYADDVNKETTENNNTFLKFKR